MDKDNLYAFYVGRTGSEFRRITGKSSNKGDDYYYFEDSKADINRNTFFVKGDSFIAVDKNKKSTNYIVDEVTSGLFRIKDVATNKTYSYDNTQDFDNDFNENSLAHIFRVNIDQYLYANINIFSIRNIHNGFGKLLKQNNDSTYELIFNDGYGLHDANRRSFLVRGDIFTYRTLGVTSNPFFVETITPTLIELKLDNGKIFTYYSFYEFADEIDVKTIKFINRFNIDEILDNPQQTNEEEIKVETTAKLPVREKSDISKMEDQIVYLNKDISDLTTLKSFLSPLDFEEKIKINSQISAIEKEIGQKVFDIAEAELKKSSKSESIISELFDNSFRGIKRNYDVFSPTENDNSEFFAPDGTASKLSDELNFIIRTPQFKTWFGDWQTAYQFKDDPDYSVPCSKIVLPNGEPEIYWHGTGVPFSYFKFDTFPAAYFAKKKEYSEFFAKLHGGDKGYTLPFFLNVRNPLDLRHFRTEQILPKDFFDFMFVATGLDIDGLKVNPLTSSSSKPLEVWIYLRNNQQMLAIISTMYDGIRYYETNPNVKPSLSAHETEAVIVFSPHQVKLASENRGNFVLSSLRSFLLKKGGKI